MKWIKINLPWSVDRPHFKDPPDLKAEVKAQFGTSLASLDKKFEALEEKLNGKMAFSTVWDLMEKHQDKLKKFPIGSVKRARLIAKEWAKQPGREEIANLWLKIQEVKRWKDDHPQTKAWHKAYMAFLKSPMPDSFTARGLNKPGTRIEVQDGTVYWIGDINVNKGVCDDCTAFENDTVVVRYQEPPK